MDDVIAQYRALLDDYDPLWIYTDDHRVYQYGSARQKALRDLAAQLPDDVWKALYNARVRDTVAESCAAEYMV